MNNRKVRVVIADDHELLRAGLILTLSKEPLPELIEVVGEAANGYDAGVLCLGRKPDVLILDLHMPGKVDGFQLIKLLRQKQLPLKILVLTADELYEGFIPGADAYILKTEPNEKIVAKVMDLCSSDFEGIVKTQGLKFLQGKNFENEIELELLTMKEREVLELLAAGLNAESIARSLKISKKTVDNHLTSIYKKLKVEGLPQAIIFAYENNLVRRKQF